MKTTITANLLSLATVLSTGLFAAGCSNQTSNNQLAGRDGHEQIRGNDRSMQAPKEYVPVFVEWSHDKSIRKGAPASFQFRVHALQDLEDVVLTPVLHPMMHGQDNTSPSSVGSLPAGQERVMDVVASPGQDGEFTVGIHVSATYQGRTLGTIRTVSFSTDGAAALKPESDPRLRKAQNGEPAVYVLPGGTTH